ncbi:T9SS type A sorting domain-containing protein [Ferruginibacter albus]|uniref:T9SS type A sorting domain-containing protein n=1 Tax=Ferruginibacter albus TaxID=2875540 RepID=UPI001CC746C4|nr:T9SS type A sorting domain-containing protein [Ferruginibacter albus]UAY52767.1 T9SS type A sorting domain-containing protein [Ferruginibacter albus]
MEEASAKLIKFYPNPATSDITFEYQYGYDKSYTLQLYNFLGKKVYELTTTSPKISLSLTNFFRGIYVYQLRDKRGKIVESGKFQVVK